MSPVQQPVKLKMSSMGLAYWKKERMKQGPAQPHDRKSWTMIPTQRPRMVCHGLRRANTGTPSALCGWGDRLYYDQQMHGCGMCEKGTDRMVHILWTEPYLKRWKQWELSWWVGLIALWDYSDVRTWATARAKVCVHGHDAVNVYVDIHGFWYHPRPRESGYTKLTLPHHWLQN